MVKAAFRTITTSKQSGPVPTLISARDWLPTTSMISPLELESRWLAMREDSPTPSLGIGRRPVSLRCRLAIRSRQPFRETGATSAVRTGPTWFPESTRICRRMNGLRPAGSTMRHLRYLLRISGEMPAATSSGDRASNSWISVCTKTFRYRKADAFSSERKCSTSRTHRTSRFPSCRSIVRLSV